MYIHIYGIYVYFLFFKLDWIGLSVGIVECGAAENKKKKRKSNRRKRLLKSKTRARAALKRKSTNSRGMQRDLFVFLSGQTP